MLWRLCWNHLHQQEPDNILEDRRCAAFKEVSLEITEVLD